MLAGASSASWRKPVPGTELFSSKEWETTGPAVRDAYRSWWRRWQNETTPHIPGQVARVFRTVALGFFAFEIRGAAWELRLARVEHVGHDWLEWQPVKEK